MQYVILYWTLYFKKLNKHFGDNKNILIKVLGYGNIAALKENVFVLRTNVLTYLGVKCHDVSNFHIVQRKKYVDIWKQNVVKC